MTEDGPYVPRIDQTVLARLVVDLGPDDVADVCSIFVSDARQGLRVVRSGCDARDADAVARAAHRMKSASGFVGAEAISALCAEIEALVLVHRFDEVAPRVDLVAEELEHASQELAVLVGRLRRPGPAVT